MGLKIHQQITATPYVFSRSYSKGNYKDTVVVALEMSPGVKEISVGKTFANGTKVKDAYSGFISTVKNGKVSITSEFGIVLLEKL